MPIGGEKLHKIEDLKTKLSGRNYQVRRNTGDNFTHLNKKKVLDTWTLSPKDEKSFAGKLFMKSSAFKKFLTFSVIFFLLAVGFAAYTFFVRGNTISNENIDMAILGNAFVAGGEELPLQIEVTNRNSSPLLLADLLIEYPKSSSSDLASGNERLRVSLGSIPAGGVRNENAKITLFGGQGSIKPIKIILEYRIEGSNAIFVKEKEYQVTISSTPLNITLDAPTEASSNQDITFNIKSVLNATRPATKMMVKVDYPLGFQFGSAKPSPSLGNNIWSMGDLSPGSERDISITGKILDASDGEEKTFHIYSGTESAGNKSEIGVVFNSISHTLLIKKPFIEARLFVNGIYQQQYAVDEKTPLSGEIHWANNLDTQVNDLEIRAKISGNAVDRKKISVQQGFYNSSQNTIIWDKNSQSKFREVSPSEEGVEKFSISPLSLFTGSGILSEPTIYIDVSVVGKQPLEGNSVGELTNTESKTIRIISGVGFAGKALYFSGPFKNTGPIPPKVEQKTTYTISWSISNTANNISKVQVRTTLPPWVNFVGPISPPAEDLIYDPSTKEIFWNIGNVKKGLGVTEGGREVSFQVELLPSFSQVGSAPVIVNDATLTGHDDFANVDVRVNKASLDTRLGSDPYFPATGDRVTE